MKKATVTMLGIAIILLSLSSMAQQSSQDAGMTATRQPAYFFNSFGWDSSLNGKPIAPFSMVTPSGQKLSSEGLRGKVIVLDFWATWCGPCRNLTHDLDSALKKYYGRDFIMIGVNFLESTHPGNPIAYWKEKDYQFPMTLKNDAYGKSVGAGNPVVILIDQQGIVRGKWQAFTTLRAGEVEGMVWKLLDKPVISQQAVLDANRNKEYIKALYLYEALIVQDPSQEKILAQEKFRALLHLSEWEGVDFAKEWRKNTGDEEQTLATIGDYISQTQGLTPKIYAFGADAFETLVKKYPENGKSLIVYDLMGRCYFRSGEKGKALEYGEKSLALARVDANTPSATIEYLESVLKKYKEDK